MIRQASSHNFNPPEPSFLSFFNISFCWHTACIMQDSKQHELAHLECGCHLSKVSLQLFWNLDLLRFSFLVSWFIHFRELCACFVQITTETGATIVIQIIVKHLIFFPMCQLKNLCICLRKWIMTQNKW